MTLTLDQVTKYYGGQEILKGIDLKLEGVSVVALLGASGSGKSTLLRQLAGLEQVDSGCITINGHTLSAASASASDFEALKAYRRTVGFVFQEHALFPHLSVVENIVLILEKVHGRRREDVMPEVLKWLEQFGLLEQKDKRPHQMSGGQAQRAAIVRALCIHPEILLFDEPTSALDPILTGEVLGAVSWLAAQNRDFIIVTHEIGFARKVADYVVFMDEGVIVEHGSTAILETPQTEKLKRFMETVQHF